MTEIIDEIVMAPAMETEDDSPIEPMATDDTQTAAHRTDFTSELYKIELNNVGKFGYGVSKQNAFKNFIQHSNCMWRQNYSVCPPPYEGNEKIAAQ